ncbi:NAD-dependent epimerase/dehydratase family protein [Providencia rettgeri]
MEKVEILVSGGMGYIGSHTCVELIKAGYYWSTPEKAQCELHWKAT